MRSRRDKACMHLPLGLHDVYASPANIEPHHILGHDKRSRIVRPRLVNEIALRWRRELRTPVQQHVRIDRELRLGARKNDACFLGLSVMGEDSLKNWCPKELVVNDGNLMDQQVHADRKLDHILRELRITRQHNRTPVIVNTETKCGLEEWAMVDIKCCHLHPVSLVDDALENFDRRGCDPFLGQVRVGDPCFDIPGVGLFQARHQPLRAFRSPETKGRVALGKCTWEPSGEPYVGKAYDMVGVEMSEEHRIETANSNAGLPKTLRHPAPGIKQQRLLAGSNKSSGSKSRQ